MSLAAPAVQRSLWWRLGLLSTGLAALSCNEQLGGGLLLDTTPPSVSIKKTADTVDINQGVTFTVTAGDAVSLKRVTVTVTGAATASFDTTFTTTTPAFSAQFNATVGAGTAGGRIRIQADVTDGAGNAASAQDSVTVFDGQPPAQTLLEPKANTTSTQGDTIDVIVRATDPSGVAKLGGLIYTTDALGTINTVRADSVTYATPPLGVTDTLRVPVPDTLKPGAYLIGTFAVDGVGNRGLGTPVNATVADTLRPTITMMQPGSGLRLRAGDSVRVQARVQDRGGVTSVRFVGVAHRGVRDLGTDTVVTRFTAKSVTLKQVPDTTLMRDLRAEADQTAEFVYIVAVASDSSGNTARDSVRIEIVSGPILSILAPLPNTIIGPGQILTVTVRGIGVSSGVKKLGYTTSGVLATVDTSFVYPTTNPQVRDTTRTVALTVPAATALGTFTIDPFGRDSLGSIGGGQPVVVQVVSYSVASDTTPPLVSDSLAIRAEARDSIKVRAVDLGGIAKIGFTISTLAGANLTGDSASFTAARLARDTAVMFSLKLDTLTAFPRLVVVTAFAVDSLANRGVLSRTTLPVTSSGTPDTLGARDTVTIVAGITINLPRGGRVADAIYNQNRNELYLTNEALDRVEVFQLVDTTFMAGGIPVGAKPWGIALWPRNTLGANADTVVVANSAGTNLSIVNVNNPGRREMRRHALPNFLIEKVKLTRDPSTSLITGYTFTDFDFSDRPQYLGMVCRTTTGLTACAPDSVYAVYSTTPSLDQGTPPASDEFKLRGTVRWENLTSAVPESHFFWEHARPAALADSTVSYPDTIQIVADLGGRAGPQIIVGASCFLSLIFDNLAFRDTTYVRNSGNFTHAFVGEGGDIGNRFARVLAFNAPAGVARRACPQFPAAPATAIIPASQLERELGVSPARHVLDFISNTAIPVRSIATNFNGKTNLVRADSIYVLDDGLRHTGTIGSDVPNYGMDLNFDHRFTAGVGGTTGTWGTVAGDSTARMVFAARADANIDVFDTYFHARITTIPIKDPVIGPLRVAKLPTGEQVLIGATARGVVVAKLPAVTNPFPAPPALPE
ncbi:MAG: hypothetical protein HY560_07145 [Gemmatimonadetes bacterium]|nr:hypothetical protein [Gemmatimonadota bacterium]